MCNLIIFVLLTVSSCLPPPDTCGWDHMLSEEPNIYTLSGALVGGPDLFGNHIDERTNSDGNSVAIDYNAGFTAAVAGKNKLGHSLKENLRTVEHRPVC